MKALFRARTMAALGFLGLAGVVPLVNAGPRSTCDEISNDVRRSVSKDPSKVLMIVEDALVINENCACEIVKAAITSSNADDALVVQIVQTALAVAPKMSAVIAECATAAAPASGAAIAALVGDKGKSGVADASSTGDGKGVVAGIVPTGDGAAVVASAAGPAEGSEYSNAWSTNIRGVYLVQPAAAGFISVADSSSKSDHATKDKGSDTDDEKVNRANSRRTRNLVPLSPANALP